MELDPPVQPIGRVQQSNGYPVRPGDNLVALESVRILEGNLRSVEAAAGRN